MDTELKNSVWILGAGFSKSFGFPLASELHSAALDTPLDPSMADRVSCIQDAAPVWSLLSAYFAEDELERCSLEDVLGALSVLARDAGSMSSSRLRESLFGLHLDGERIVAASVELTERALRCIRYHAAGFASNELVGRLITKLHREGAGIITLNFDNVIERVASSVGVQVTHSPNDPGSLSVFHPHGSAYWYWQYAELESHSSGGLELYRVEDPTGRQAIVRRHDDPDHPLFDGPIVAKFFKETKHACCVRMDASKGIEWFLGPQWSAASQLLRRARLWVIVGYSFPESDQLLRLWFMSHLVRAYSEDKRFPRIIVVDPAATDSAFRGRLRRVVTNEALFVPLPVLEALASGDLWEKIASPNQGG